MSSVRFTRNFLIMSLSSVTFPTVLNLNPYIKASEDGAPEIDYTYELYAIMVHSGGALGGHYYAYIQ